MEDLATHIEEAISFLKNMAPEVYAIYVRQAMLTGWMIVSGTAATAVMSALCFILWLPNVDRSAGDEAAPIVTGCVLAVATAILLIILFVEGVPMILNPEFYAIRELLP